MVKEFINVTSVEEALKAKEKGYSFYAGGTEINRLNSLIKADRVVSISNLGLNEIKDGFVGAMCTFQQIIESQCIPEELKTACKFNYSLQNRNRATIGGNIASARDDSFLIPYLAASEALLVVEGRGELTIKDYLQKREGLITSVLLNSNNVVSQKRIARAVRSRAVLTLAAGEETICIALKGSPIFILKRLSGPEETISMLKNNKLINPVSDIWGSREYKEYLIETIMGELLQEV